MSLPKAEVKDRLKEALELKGISAAELARRTGISKASLSQYITGRVKPKQDRIYMISKALNLNEAWLLGFNVPMNSTGNTVSQKQSEHSNVAPAPNFLTSNVVSIPVYGSVPAGIPVEAIQDIDGYVDIPEDWASHGRYIGLTVSGASMYPKYLEGDIIVIKLQPEAVSGQDAVVYVNGYDATLKTVFNESDGGTTLKPINPEYQTKTYEPGVVRVLGVVKRLVREI